MNDRELLELAAKAAGIGDVDVAGRPCVLVVNDYGISQRCWNPLTDDGDALRLAVKLKLYMATQFDKTNTFAQGMNDWVSEHHGDDPYAATRRAIVRAAAEIGRAM